MESAQRLMELSKRFHSLIPLNGKRPIEQGWNKYCYEPRPFDPRDFEGRNAGITTGPANGLIVIDIDDKDGFLSWINENRFPLPRTFTVYTGGNGRSHLYYAHPLNGQSFGNRSFAYFDIKADGGVVVAPGSIHPDTGQEYVVSHDWPIALAPHWLIDLCLNGSEFVPPSQAKGGDATPCVEIDSLEISDKIKTLIRKGELKGKRSEAIQRVINSLIAVGLSDNKIISIFNAYPIGEKYKEKKDSRGAWLLAQLEKGRKYISERLFPSGFTAAELEREEIPELQWICHNLITLGLTLVSGPPKGGKTRLATNIAVSVAMGTKALNEIETYQCGVLFLSLEDSRRRIKDRLSAMLDDSPFPSNLHFFIDWPTIEDRGMERLDKFLSMNASIKLVIIDTLGRLRKSQKRGDIYQIDSDTMAKIKSVADKHSVAILLVHHTNKIQDAPDIFDKVSGSTGLTGSCDTVAILKRDDRTEADATLHIAGRDVEAQNLALSFDNYSGTWRLLGDVDLFCVTSQRKQIMDYLTSQSEPKRAIDIAKALSKNHSTVRGLCSKMLKAGQIIQPTPGFYSIINDVNK